MRVAGALWPLFAVLASTCVSLNLQASPATFVAPASAGPTLAHSTALLDSDSTDYSDRDRDRDRRDRSDASDDDSTKNVVESFAGIWVADGNEAMKLADGCSMIMRLTAKPAQLIRAVICANGNLETATASVRGITIEPSRFPGGFQFRTRLRDVSSSCTDDQESAYGSLQSLAFDLKTAAGGEAATFAYTKLGDVDVAMHSGGAIDLFNRNRDCGTITSLASGLADNAENRLVKLAAKVCAIDSQPAGCFTTGGYVANYSSN